jgi:exodeoxyribonuclease V alpha subunit
MSHEEFLGSQELAFRLDMEQALARGDTQEYRACGLIFADWLEDKDRDDEANNLRKEINDTAKPAGSAWVPSASLPGLSPHQREQLGVATSRPLGILCGTPGTGKTHVAATLATATAREHGTGRIAVVAPTGKAAVRIAESIRLIDPHTQIGPSTIHQLLGIDRAGYDGHGWSFNHDRDNPLPQRFFILDEPSMLSLDLCADLFRAIRPGAHLLMVGDPDQLPPVGHGAVLRDLIATKVVPVGRLTEIHRNGGAIAAACAAIRAGEQDEAIRHATDTWWRDPATSPIFEHGPPNQNWRHIEATSPEMIAAVLRLLLLRSREYNPEPTNALAPSIQIISPVREKGPASCAAVNSLCQSVLNESRVSTQIKAWGTQIREGDRIVSNRNHHATLHLGTGGTQYVANGETGLVVSTGKPAVGTFGLTSVRLARDEEDTYGLGYCITGHRSQGSEWPVTIVLLDQWNGQNVMGREWVYTVLSRARNVCITIGRLWSVRRAVAETKLEVRRTFLDRKVLDRVVSHGA